MQVLAKHLRQLQKDGIAARQLPLNRPLTPPEAYTLAQTLESIAQALTSVAHHQNESSAVLVVPEAAIKLLRYSRRPAGHPVCTIDALNNWTRELFSALTVTHGLSLTQEYADDIPLTALYSPSGPQRLRLSW